MYTLVASALVGAILATRGRPKTRCIKKSLLGPKTGATYALEDFPDAGFILVIAQDGSRAVFQRRAASPSGGEGFAWQHGRGRPETLRAIYTDVVGEPPPATAVGPKAVPNAAPRAAGSKANRGTP